MLIGIILVICGYIIYMVFDEKKDNAEWKIFTNIFPGMNLSNPSLPLNQFKRIWNAKDN